MGVPCAPRNSGTPPHCSLGALGPGGPQKSGAPLVRPETRGSRGSFMGCLGNPTTRGPLPNLWGPPLCAPLLRDPPHNSMTPPQFMGSPSVRPTTRGPPQTTPGPLPNLWGPSVRPTTPGPLPNLWGPPVRPTAPGPPPPPQNNSGTPPHFMGSPPVRPTTPGPPPSPPQLRDPSPIHGVPPCAPYNSGTPPQFMGSPPVRPTYRGPPPQFHDPSPLYGVPLCALHIEDPPQNSGTPPQFMGSPPVRPTSRGPPQTTP